MIELMELPFEVGALEPVISKKTVEFHYGKHHRAYVDKVNELIIGTEFQNMALEEIIKRTFDEPEQQTLYNNAGQVYNHNIYWQSVGRGERLSSEERDKILDNFETIEALKTKLVDEAVKLFGSGWVWLVKNKRGDYEVLATKNGDTPLVLGYESVFNIDVWEHAYYLDYQNLRKKYAESFIADIIKI